MPPPPATSCATRTCIQVTGRVDARLPGTENEKLATGEVEIVCTELDILNKADVLPFQLDRELSNEDLRMKYRYLDLRRPRMNRTSACATPSPPPPAATSTRPASSRSKPRSFPTRRPKARATSSCPSRLNPGRFYALPQAPQQFKQLLMVAGLEKYFQIARCFRDEDLRADRQPEFTQIDIEASFIGQEDIIKLVEGLLAAMFKAGAGVDVPTPFPRMTYREAMDRFGSDKPDTRFGMEITDLGDVFAGTEFKIFKGTLENGGVVRAINAKGFAGITTGQMNRLNEVAIQAGLPVKTLAFIKAENGEYKSPLWKFFTDAEKAALIEKTRRRGRRHRLLRRRRLGNGLHHPRPRPPRSAPP